MRSYRWTRSSAAFLTTCESSSAPTPHQGRSSGKCGLWRCPFAVRAPLGCVFEQHLLRTRPLRPPLLGLGYAQLRLLFRALQLSSPVRTSPTSASNELLQRHLCMPFACRVSVPNLLGLQGVSPPRYLGGASAGESLNW